MIDEAQLRDLVPRVLGILVRRGVDFATAEDAVQDALVEAARTWPDRQPADPQGWLVTVAWRKFLDAHRSAVSRRDREQRVAVQPPPGPTEAFDDSLALFFLCAHPSLTRASAVALTLRAVGGLTTRQIAQAHLVPEGQLASMTDDEETAGLLALMLLHHARRPARTHPDGSLVALAEQDRSCWDTALIAEGVAILQAALARDRLGEFQAQAAIAALHADSPRAQETDWVQIVGWYDELLPLTESPVVRLNRAVAIGEADGAAAGLAALAEVDPELPRHTAAAAYLHERAGDPERAATLYARAARSAPNLPERDHLTRQAARVRQALVTRERAR